MHRVIGVMSGKGGVGKTVTAINLSAALHERGQETTIVDADISSANLTVHLGLPDARESIQDVLERKTELYRTIRVIPHGLRIIPASLSLEKSLSDMTGLGEAVRGGGLEGITIIDSPPGFSKENYHIMEASDEILIVTNPDVPAITDAVKTIEIAKRMGKRISGIVINRVEKSPSEILVTEIEALCEAPLLGVIPEDKQVKKSIFERTPLLFHSPHSRAAVGYRRLAARLVGEEYSPPPFLWLRRLVG